MVKVKNIKEFDEEFKDIEEYVPMTDVEGKRIIIYGYEERDGNFGTYIAIDCEDHKEGKRLIVSTGSRRVMLKLSKLKKIDAFPVICTVVRKGQKYDII